jgi:Sulfotransferase family
VSSRQLDFCLIGTLKAGTTSVFTWLAAQEAICPSLSKEPHYWCAPDQPLPFCGPGDSFWFRGHVTDSTKYWSLFDHKAGLRGEASTGYLYDPAALTRIREACPDCKIVAILREPVARLYAAYRMAVRDGYEPAPSFDAALEAEESRVSVGWGPLYHYRRVSRYGGQLRFCFDVFDPKQVLVVFFEELVAKPTEVLKQIADFLEFTPSNWELPFENEGLVPRRPKLRNAMVATLDLARPVARSLRIGTGRYWGNAMLRRINRLTMWKPALPADRRSELVREYREDVAQVEALVGRSLPDSWHGR